MTASNRSRDQERCICEHPSRKSADPISVIDEKWAILGHEIRNPLSALSYALQVWPSSNDDPEATEQLLQIMRRQVAQLTRLCNDLLDNGISDQSNLTICQANIDVRDAIQNACDEIRPFAEQCGHTITCALGETPLVVFGDASRLTQVFANVMQNAAKFTSGGGQLKISLERGQDQDTAIVRLSDNGRGLCAHQLQSLFLADNKLKKCSNAGGEGLGIGLRLAKSIVELHGGTIEAFSDGVGRGCTFVITLPACSGAPIDAQKAPAPPCEPGKEISSRLPNYRILVVDDDRSMRLLLARLLKNLNQSVTTAEDGETAFELTCRLHPCVVFLDLQMHGMSGYEVARRIRLRTELTGVVLVALSGSSDATSRQLAAESGFDKYLVKPTSIRELTDTLLSIGALFTC